MAVLAQVVLLSLLALSASCHHHNLKDYPNIYHHHLNRHLFIPILRRHYEHKPLGFLFYPHVKNLLAPIFYTHEDYPNEGLIYDSFYSHSNYNYGYPVEDIDFKPYPVKPLIGDIPKIQDVVENVDKEDKNVNVDKEDKNVEVVDTEEIKEEEEVYDLDVRNSEE